MMLLMIRFLFVTFAFAADPDSVFVQSQSTQLRKDPQASAAPVAELKRGDALTVLKREGPWLQVKTSANAEGWVPKILTSTVKPIGQAQLLKDTANLDSNAKTSRRRTSDYAVSAATRGLAASERHRPGDEAFRSNRKAVDELEKVRVSPDQVKKFKQEGQLSEP